MTGIMIGFTRARHLLGTVYGNYSLTAIDTGLNVYGSGLYGIGGATISLPASPSTNQTIEINNTGTGTVIVPGILTKEGVDYSGTELSTGAKVKISWNGVTWDVIRGMRAVYFASLNLMSGSVTLSNNNLTAAFGTGLVETSIGKASGKWYWEYHVDSISMVSEIDSFSFDISNAIGGYGVAFGSTTGDVIGFALDLDTLNISTYVNNVLFDSADLSASGNASAYFTETNGIFVSGGTAIITANFGATTFAYTPPSGYNSGLYE